MATTSTSHNGENKAVGDESVSASNSKSHKREGDATGSGERFAAFFHIVKAMYEARKGSDGAIAAETLLISRLEARSAEFPDPIFLSVCDRETAIHDISVILDKHDDSSETIRQLMTTVKVIKVFLENIEFESPHASDPATATVAASTEETPAKKPKKKAAVEADDSGSAEEEKKKEQKKPEKKSKKVVEEPAKKKGADAASKKRKARKSESESEDSVEKKRDNKKRRCEEDKDASKTKAKDETVAAKSKPPATPRTKKRESELYVLRDGAKIAPLFIKEGQTLTNFVPAGVEQGDSSVFVWSTETYEGDEKDLNIFHKKIVFSKRWFAVDIRDAKHPKLTLKSLTKTEMKKRGCEVTKSDIEDKFVALVRKHNLVKPAVAGGEESDDSYEKTGKEAKKFMAALRRKNGEFQTQTDPFWKMDRKVDEDDEDDEDATFWTTLTELLPSKIKKGKPSKYAEFEEHAGKRYAKYTTPADIKYDGEGTAIWMPVYLESAFTNTKKLMSEPCNGFISTSAWYFDTEEAFEKACESLREISVALSKINPPSKTAKKTTTTTAAGKSKSAPVVEKAKKSKKSEKKTEAKKEEKKPAKKDAKKKEKKAEEKMEVESSAEEKKTKVDKKSNKKMDESVESSEHSKKSKSAEPKSSKKSEKTKKKRVSSSSSSSRSDDS